jgi:hypothetical protein
MVKTNVPCPLVTALANSIDCCSKLTDPAWFRHMHRSIWSTLYGICRRERSCAIKGRPILSD